MWFLYPSEQWLYPTLFWRVGNDDEATHLAALTITIDHWKRSATVVRY